MSEGMPESRAFCLIHRVQVISPHPRLFKAGNTVDFTATNLTEPHIIYTGRNRNEPTAFIIVTQATILEQENLLDYFSLDSGSVLWFLSGPFFLAVAHHYSPEVPTLKYTFGWVPKILQYFLYPQIEDIFYISPATKNP